MRILRRFLARVKIFAMGQRSREFDIRIAVGATRGNVMAVVFHQGLVLTLIATSVGVGAALPAARALTQLLFGITPLGDKLLLVCRFAGIDVSRRMCHPGTAVRAP